MSGEFRRTEAPHDPPWSLDALADFHADAVDEAQQAEWRTLLARDPAAREAVDAFDATLRDLRQLGDSGEVEPEPIPVDIGARIEDALRIEAAAREEPAPAPVVSLDAARRRRRMRWGTGLLAAAAAVTGIAIVAPLLSEHGKPQAEDSVPPPENPGAQPHPGSPSPAPLALHGSEVELAPAQLTDLLGSHQLGALSQPEKLLGCLRANGVHSGKPLGSRTITLDGQPAQLLILPNGNIGQFRLLAVGPECGPGNPATLSDTVFGG